MRNDLKQIESIKVGALVRPSDYDTPWNGRPDIEHKIGLVIAIAHGDVKMTLVLWNTSDTSWMSNRRLTLYCER